MYENYLFYDIEVFKHNSMVVFKNYEGETVRVFSSHLDGLGEYVDKGLIQKSGFDGLREFIEGKTLVGYNNHFYDDKILYAMTTQSLDHKPFEVRQNLIKSWNDSLIKRGSDINIKSIDICKSLDCFQQIDVSRPSLKKVEGNMGASIVESDVDFNIDRLLTPQENLETLKYCEYDVLNTVKIFKMRKGYYDSKDAIVDMIEKDYLKERAYKWNTTSIVGQILKPKAKVPERKILPAKEILSYVPAEVQDMWEELWHTIDCKFKTKKIVVEEFGNVVEFGWGGLHGAPKGFLEAENVKLKDVDSMYPSLLINLKGLGDKTKDYKDILDYRLELKRQGKKKEQAPYKLILNSTYGLLNNQYSQLNNPKLAYSICIHGQVALYVLAQRLASVGARIININTDGVAYTLVGDKDEKIAKEWEKEFNLRLSTDYFKKWIQKDVNNYIAITDDDKVKVKGADVNKYHESKYFANNDIRITHMALVDYLLYDKPIYDTLLENLDKPILYQYVLKAGNTYKGVAYKSKPEELLTTTVNRVFASKQGDEIVKIRQDDGIVKFADTPNQMYLYNDDLKDFDNFKEIIDLQWYHDLINKNLKRWRV